MLTKWNKLLNTDCHVYALGDNFVYPIMRNATTSLRTVTGLKYTNNEIKKCQNIIVFLREPVDRFISGINQYCLQNKTDLYQTYNLVQDGKLVDRHFSPQWIWLLHLSKYHKGMISLKSLDDVGAYCKEHLHKLKNKIIDIEPPDQFITADKELVKHIGQNIDLRVLVRKCKNVLS